MISTLVVIATFSIPAGPGIEAFPAWGKTSELDYMGLWSQLISIPTNPVNGAYGPLDALTIMLEGTHFGYEIMGTTAFIFPCEGDECIPRCMPELGALAPTPPCRHRPAFLRTFDSVHR